MASFDEKFIASIQVKLKFYIENSIGSSKNFYEEIKKCDVEDISSCEDLEDFIQSEINSFQERKYLSREKNQFEQIKNYKTTILEIREMVFSELKNVSPEIHEQLIKYRNQNDSLSKPRRHLRESSSSSSFFEPEPLSGEKATVLPPSENPPEDQHKQPKCCVLI
jgi:hypothetical protein